MTSEYVRRSYCANCYEACSGVQPLEDAASYCDRCAHWRRELDRAYQQLATLRTDAMERSAALSLPLPIPALRDPEDTLGRLAHARPGTGFLIRRHPDLAFLAYLTSPAIDFYRETQATLAEFFDDVKPHEWRLLLEAV